MDLPSNLAHGGSLETVPQRRSCMARSGVVKVAITAGALSKETIKKHSKVSFFARIMYCTIIYLNVPASLCILTERDQDLFVSRGTAT